MANSNVKVQAQTGSNSYYDEYVGSGTSVSVSEMMTHLERAFASFPSNVQRHQDARRAYDSLIDQIRDLRGRSLQGNGFGRNTITKSFRVDNREYRLDIEVNREVRFT